VPCAENLAIIHCIINLYTALYAENRGVNHRIWLVSRLRTYGMAQQQIGILVAANRISIRQNGPQFFSIQKLPLLVRRIDGAAQDRKSM